MKIICIRFPWPKFKRHNWDYTEYIGTSYSQPLGCIPQCKSWFHEEPIAEIPSIVTPGNIMDNSQCDIIARAHDNVDQLAISYEGGLQYFTTRKAKWNPMAVPSRRYYQLKLGLSAVHSPEFAITSSNFVTIHDSVWALIWRNIPVSATRDWSFYGASGLFIHYSVTCQTILSIIIFSAR